MLILFTSEENQTAEKEQLTRIFEAGLPLLHVRKPEMTEEELELWLSDFEEKHLQKMVLHQHYHLAKVFRVKGIHLKEDFRRKKAYLAEYVEHFRMNSFSVSSSFHYPQELRSGALLFDYAFLGPVFTSVSKRGYKGRGFNVENLSYKVIALGGIEADKILLAKELGYAGVAVLGAVWTAKDKEQAFTGIYNEYRNIYQ